MTRILNALARRPAPPDPARATMRAFVRTLARLAAPRTDAGRPAAEAER
ncbi:hypothetical protein [Salinarimonas rosea]|nr:hypothetical protein [Salinarimonas rosea]